MESILQSMLVNLEDREQLRVLLKKAHTMVVFSTEEEKWHLFLSTSELHTNYSDKGRYRIHLFGSKESIQEIIRGEASIRQLQKLNKIQVQGNYRQVLLIEAIFLLSRSQQIV
ncbi:hypothetical protein [Bacillus massiliigorillae]|uniref:hypothetical protein n=1 Tax=Bacillus massiliigorillae TaxID=1243664 RepID=UPI00039BA90C|nr:hypothetical protein [Bacillus massiliigorillae]